MATGRRCLQDSLYQGVSAGGLFASWCLFAQEITFSLTSYQAILFLSLLFLCQHNGWHTPLQLGMGRDADWVEGNCFLTH
jgi:hypothetical protein